MLELKAGARALRDSIYTVTGPRLLGELTSEEVGAMRLRTQTVILAAGSVEEHGPHLPLLSDFYQGEEFLRRVVAALAKEGVEVLGGLCVAFAPAEDTLSFPGTISIKNETFLALMRDVLGSLYSHGFRRFPILVTHEQTMGPLMAAVRAFNGDHGDASAGVLTGWYQAGVGAIKSELCEGAEPALDGHAGEIETSRMLAAREELVQMVHAQTFYPQGGRPRLPYDEYPLAGGGLYRPSHDYQTIAPDGFIGDATKASREKGDRSFDEGVEWACEIIKRDFLGM